MSKPLKGRFPGTIDNYYSFDKRHCEVSKSAYAFQSTFNVFKIFNAVRHSQISSCNLLQLKKKYIYIYIEFYLEGLVVSVILNQFLRANWRKWPQLWRRIDNISKCRPVFISSPIAIGLPTSYKTVFTMLHNTSAFGKLVRVVNASVK